MIFKAQSNRSSYVKAAVVASTTVLSIEASLASELYANGLCESELHLKLDQGEFYLGRPGHGYRKMTTDQLMQEVWIGTTLIGERLMVSRGVFELPVREIAAEDGLCEISAVIEPRDSDWDTTGVKAGPSYIDHIWVSCFGKGLSFRIVLPHPPNIFNLEPLFPGAAIIERKRVPIHYRVDEGSYETMYMEAFGSLELSPSRTLFSGLKMTEAEIDRFIDKILDGDVLHVRIESDAGSSLDHAFQITGLRKSIGSMRQSCKYFSVPEDIKPLGLK